MFKELEKNTPKEMGPYLSSKWINHYFLIDTSELQDFINNFDTTCIFPIGKILTNYQDDVVERLFVEYDRIVKNLKKNIVDLNALKIILPIAISKSANTFYLYSPKENCSIIKIIKPVLQLQLNFFRYSVVNNTILLNSLGNDSIFWGFKLSYPQIFQDPKSNKIVKVDDSFDNFSYFRLVRKWLREKTLPVKFIDNQKKINTSLRVGKKCLSWVNLHPQLKESELEFDNAY